MSEPASRSAWPATDGVVFLCDTSSGLERSMLADWVRSTAPEGRDAASLEMLHVALEGGAHADPKLLGEVLEREAPTTLVPLRVAWLPERDMRHSGPRLRDLLLGDPRHPRRQLARLISRQNPDRARCIAGAPASLGELRDRFERLAVQDGERLEDFEAFVLRQAGIALDVEERKLHGRRYKVPRFVIAGIESSNGYQAATARLATTLARTPKEVRGDARRYLTEMVATPNTFFIDWMGTLTRWITSLGYQEIVTDPENIERTRKMLRDHPSALLWTHKSHVDAIALLSVMYDNDFPAPHSIGGINMAFAGVGYAGRRAGTIYIRRSFSDNPVYKVALQQYLGYLMEKRFPLSWAFEGTRSRNGKLGRPRYGLLKYVVDAAHATATEDLHIIPVGINYDLIGETTDYALEESGEPKEAESLGWFVEYLRRLKSPMGNIYIDFGEPVVLKGAAPAASDELLPQLAFEVARRVNDRVPVTLPSLMCMALLGAAPRALTYPELNKAMRSLLGWLRRHDIRLARSLERVDVPALESLAENVFSGGVVQRVTDGPETLFEIGEGQYPVASYYRNTIIHYFVDKAIAEVALARVVDRDPATRVEDFWSEARWLRDLTKFEFYHTPSDQFSASVDAQLAPYDAAWQEVLKGSRGDVIALLTGLRPLVSHATLLPVLEAYWIVAKVVADLAPEEEASESDLVARALRRGRSKLRRGRVSSQASVAKGMFANAYSYLRDQGLVETSESTGEDAAEAVPVLAARLEDTIQRVREIAERAQAEFLAG